MLLALASLALSAGCSPDGTEAEESTTEPTVAAAVSTPETTTATARSPTTTVKAEPDCMAPKIEVLQADFVKAVYQIPLTPGTTWTLTKVIVKVTNSSANKIATSGVFASVDYISHTSEVGRSTLLMPEAMGKVGRPYVTIDPGTSFNFGNDVTLGAIQSDGSQPTLSAMLFDWHFSDTSTDARCLVLHPGLHN